MCSSSHKLKIKCKQKVLTAVYSFLLHRLRWGDGSEVVDDDDVEAVLIDVKGTFVDDEVLDEEDDEDEIAVVVEAA